MKGVTPNHTPSTGMSASTDRTDRKSMYRLRKEGLPAHQTWPPAPGFYERKIAGRWMPIRITAEVSTDPETGEQLDRSPQWVARVDGVAADINWVWPEWSGRVISHDQYLGMLLANDDERTREHAAVSKYDQVEDGQWWLFHEDGSNRRCKIACCDCGLVHQFRIRIRGGKIFMQANRLPKETGGFRAALKRQKAGGGR